MKKDLKLIFFEMKTHIFLYLIPFILIYTLFIYQCFHEIHYITDSYMRELIYFLVSQRYLPIFLVYFLFLIIKNHIDGPINEILQGVYVGKKLRFVIYGLVLFNISLIPYYVISYILLGNVTYSMIGLIFIFLIISCLFYCILLIFKDSLMTLTGFVIAIMLFTQFFMLDTPYMLFHTSKLVVELPQVYWFIQSVIGLVAVFIGLYIEKKKG